jgi:hypothetical protein
MIEPRATIRFVFQVAILVRHLFDRCCDSVWCRRLRLRAGVQATMAGFHCEAQYPMTDASEFHLYPRGLKAPVDPQLVWSRFINSHTTHGINVSRQVSEDLRFRLILLHEYLHAIHHPYQLQTHSHLKRYLSHAVETGRLDRGGAVVAPVFIPFDEHKSAVHNFQCIEMRPDGLVGYGTVSLANFVISVILSQCEELFADFFAAAGAGAAYWTTLWDFHCKGIVTDEHPSEAAWEFHNTLLYDPHPVSSVRFQCLPDLFVRTFRKTFIGLIINYAKGVSSEEAAAQEMWRDIACQLPPSPPDVLAASEVVYVNEFAPAPVRRVVLPLKTMLPFYEVAFEAFLALMTQWCNTGHPLAVLTFFFQLIHHDRIAVLADEFETAVPQPGYVLDDVAGIAAARLFLDRHPQIDLVQLESRATAFRAGCLKLF